MTVQQHATRPSSHLGDCVGFWLWALVGAGLVLGLISFIVVFLIPPIVLTAVLVRWSRWREGPAWLGVVAGAGLMLLVVAGLNWSDWHSRTVGDATPNPFYWGGLGFCLCVAGTLAFEIRRRRSP